MRNDIEGMASKVSPLVPDLLESDPFTNDALVADGNYETREIEIDVSRYIDPDFHEVEKERVWKKAWQYAARVEDIPCVGDRTVYTVAGLSCLLIRGEDDVIRAFVNSCPHRGTKLCDGYGSAEEIVCPFHGWKWQLNGKNKYIPSDWDFKGFDKSELGLTPIQCEVWEGYVFVNFDPDAKPLAEYLGPLVSHFASCPPSKRVTIARVKKLIKANWKVAMEAFLESYHTIETHKELLNTLADASTKYDLWWDGEACVSRLYSPMAVPSPHLGDDASPAESAKDYASSMSIPGLEEYKFQLDEKSSMTPRSQVANWRRSIFKNILGVDFSALPDGALLDAVQYWMFPNFGPWYGEGGPIAYQFLPNGNHVDECVMEVRLLAPLPDGEPLPDAPVNTEFLDYEDTFMEKAPSFGDLALVFDQDMINIPKIQQGMEAAYQLGTSKIRLGKYQEKRISFFHEVLDYWIRK